MKSQGTGRTSLADLRSRDFERILLIKPSAVGDVIHTIPVMARLRKRYPQAQIDWLITPENADLVRYDPAVSNVVLFARREFSKFGRNWAATVGPFQLIAGLRRRRYQMVIDLHGQLRSAACTLATGAPVRIGYARPRRRNLGEGETGPLPKHGWTGTRECAWVAYTHHIPIPTLRVHAVDRYLWLGDVLGFRSGPVEFQVHIPPQAVAKIERLIVEHGIAGKPLAVLVPGTIWETKHWHPEGFAGVGRHFLEQGYAVVLAGTMRDRPRCDSITQACPGIVDLSGQTKLSDLAALIKQSAICVTNDSGSMHLAVALGRPVVSVFGPTDPTQIGPYGRPNAVVRIDAPCAPCYLRKLSQCPHHHLCMTGVTAQMVTERAEAILQGAQTDAAL